MPMNGQPVEIWLKPTIGNSTRLSACCETGKNLNPQKTSISSKGTDVQGFARRAMG